VEGEKEEGEGITYSSSVLVRKIRATGVSLEESESNQNG
jgi:hypothetical protein